MLFSVEFTASACAEIAREIKRYWDGREMGGALVGQTDGSHIVVEHAGGLGVGTDIPRGESWLRPRFARYLDLANAYDADVVGCWHTHGGGDSEFASENDEILWHELRTALEVPVYVGQIFAPRLVVVPGLLGDEEMWSFEAPFPCEQAASTYLVTADGCELTSPILRGEDRYARTA